MKILIKTAKMLKFKALMLCTALIFCGINIFGQSITWQRIINNNYSNYNKVIQTHDNFFVAVGFDKINTVDYFVLSKFDFYGNVIWHKSIGSGFSRGHWIVETSDNNYIMCGSIYFDNISRIYVVKTDTSGTILWEKNYYSSDINNAYCIKETSDNSILIAGMTFPNNVGIFLLKTDMMGNVINQKIYINNYQQQIYEIIEYDNYYWGIGASSINNSDLLVLKLDKSLDTVRTKTYGGIYIDGGYSITKLENEGIILGGISQSYNSNNLYETFIIRIDTNFNTIWQKTFLTNYNEICKSINYKTGLGIIAAGSIDSIGNISSSKLRLLNLNGDIIREKTFLPGTLGAGFESVVFTNDNGTIAAGYVTFSGGFEKMYIVKTDSLLYADPIGLVNISTEIPKAFQLFQNYPNPFNSSTNIKFQINENSDVKIIIFDGLGKQINKYEFGEIKAGTYLMNWNANNFASGIYFYKIISNNYKQTKKMVLLK
ncbi:MAG: PKD repeat protein [Chlorobi bacterium OLB5]|nr:MAG: PKD repeat protein [Chlorobi bacterium OLB5]